MTRNRNIGLLLIAVLLTSMSGGGVGASYDENGNVATYNIVAEPFDMSSIATYNIVAEPFDMSSIATYYAVAEFDC